MSHPQILIRIKAIVRCAALLMTENSIYLLYTTLLEFNLLVALFNPPSFLSRSAESMTLLYHSYLATILRTALTVPP